MINIHQKQQKQVVSYDLIFNEKNWNFNGAHT